MKLVVDLRQLRAFMLVDDEGVFGRSGIKAVVNEKLLLSLHRKAQQEMQNGE